MKAKLLALLAVIIICMLAIAYDEWHQSGQSSAPPGEATQHFENAPDVAFTAQDGKSYDLKTLPEKGIVLHFWASWCAPCAAEMPELIKQIQAARGKLALVGVSIDERPSAMRKFIAKLNLKNDAHIYWVWDQNKNISLKTFNTISVPETILIDRERRMTAKTVGDPGWQAKAQKAQLQKLEETN